jgi:hypothetical protein
MDLIALYIQIKQLTPNFSKSMPTWLHSSLSQETAPLLRVAESVNTRLCVKLLGSRSSKLSKLPLTPFHRESISLASRRAAEEMCILISDLYCSTTHYVRTSGNNERSCPWWVDLSLRYVEGGYSLRVSMNWALAKSISWSRLQEEWIVLIYW